MAYIASDAVKQSLEIFQKFDADTQLALLWYGYLDIKEQLQPAPANSAEAMGSVAYDRVKLLSQDEQLQAQRDIAKGTDSPFSREYSALSSSGKLELWLLLAKGIESGEIISVPDDYELPSETDEFVEQIKALDFEQRLNFTRSAVDKMGFSPAT
ncbi:MAG: Orange carotenoid protein [Leptolyngbyaceae cyanobacterium SM1_1_3]|nr:Orange carotenoid protein [Leptolyngbyaceae cyanobacterium SM1_1_3]NJN02343.1 Orange carotenoid protein [Leptolyngbyaceae cyanobacterium RM1_1_2]NJO11727.1 Orange carotenoid protein [Leptolyngbyaceae cyanobacterium SL_1_1]